MLLKKYSDFGEGGKKSDSEFLSYNLMLNSGKKNCALHDKKHKYSNSHVVREKKFWTKKKKHSPLPPPCKLNGRSLNKFPMYEIEPIEINQTPAIPNT